MNKNQILLANFPHGNAFFQLQDSKSKERVDVISGYDVKIDEKARELEIVNDILISILAYDQIVIFANNITECLELLGYENLLCLLRKKILMVIPDLMFNPALTLENESYSPSFISFAFGNGDVQYQHKLGHLEFWLSRSKYKKDANSLLYLLEDNSVNVDIDLLRDSIIDETKKDVNSFELLDDKNFYITDGRLRVKYNAISELRLLHLNSILYVSSNLRPSCVKTDGAITNLMKRKSNLILSHLQPDGIESLSCITLQKGIPNFGDLYSKKIVCLDDIIRLRESANGKIFRRWIQEQGYDETQMRKEVMNSVSCFFGSSVSQAIRMLACNFVSIAGFFPGLTASVIDHVVFDRILKGWHPNFFLDDGLKSMIDQKVAQDKRNHEIELIKSRFRGVGRNDFCPCGSGKKFKKCHGKDL